MTLKGSSQEIERETRKSTFNLSCLSITREWSAVWDNNRDFTNSGFGTAVSHGPCMIHTLFRQLTNEINSDLGFEDRITNIVLRTTSQNNVYKQLPPSYSLEKCWRDPWRRSQRSSTISSKKYMTVHLEGVCVVMTVLEGKDECLKVVDG